MLRKVVRVSSVILLLVAIGFSVYWGVRGEWGQVFGAGTIAIVMLLPAAFPNLRFPVFRRSKKTS